MIKASKVVFISDDLEKSFNSLPEDDFLKKSIKQAIQNLRENAFYGIHIPKRLIPKEYIKKWGITNLWKYSRMKNGKEEILHTIQYLRQIRSLLKIH